MKYRLIRLIKIGKITFCDVCDFKESIKCVNCENELIAEYLLSNGVIVPPCKVGDKLYYFGYRANGGKTEKYIKEETIEMISIDSHSIYAHIPRALLIDLADLGKSVFLTREEAEWAMKVNGERE